MKSFQAFRLDTVNQCLWRGDTRISLMPKPFAVLRYLVDHPGRLVSHDELVETIWPDTYVQPEVLRRYILEIRRTLGDDPRDPRFVKTFPKRGYEFIAPVTDEREPGVVSSVAIPSARIVGRTPALGELHEHLTLALNGRRQVVFVVGEPGIGKTSLVDAFQNQLSDRPVVRVVRGQCAEGFGSQEPYYPLLEALGRLIRTDAGTTIIDLFAKHAPTWLIQFPAFVRPEQQALLQREILGATRERMVRELCEVCEAITATMGLVLVLEDLHWIDRSTLDVIAALARRPEHARLLVIGTLRPADLILSDSPLKTLKQDLVVHRYASEIALEPLQESDVTDYLIGETGGTALPPGLASIIYRHSDGNPLFMIALLDHLKRQGVLSLTAGRWTLNVPADAIDPGVPDTLKQMLEAQIRTASDAEQRLLKCASVAGNRFTAWAVATMLPSEDLSRIEEMCESLADRQQFIKPSGLRELADGRRTPEYQFRHALYREILRRRMTPSQSVSFHRSLAEGLETVRSPLPFETAAEIALHFEEGQEYERAIPHLIAAAQNATARYAHAEAIGVLDHACALLPRIPADHRDAIELQLLERIGNGYYALGDMEHSAEAYDLMARRAAEAGLLASQADALMRKTHSAESIPFFLRAVELDGRYAWAYVSLSRIYSNLGEVERSKTYARLAYECRAQVSDRERLSIDYQYHFEVSGDQEQATKTLEEWKRAFPADFRPVNSLTLIHNFLGRFDRAVDEGLEAVRRNPAHGFPYSNLAHAYRGLGRFHEARETAARAVAVGIETLPTRRLLYQLAVLGGDTDAARSHLEWARDKPREFDMVGAQAQVTGWSGKVSEARALYQRACDMADSRKLPDVGTSHLAWATWMDIAFGNVAGARDDAHRVLARAPSYDPKLRAALALALTGADQEAERITRELTSANPDHTFINVVLAPIVRAGIELGRSRPAEAIAALQCVGTAELGFIAALAPIHLRAQAFLMAGEGGEACLEFERLLHHRGSDPFSAFHAVAPLGLARAHAMTGNTAASLSAYASFLSAWKDADRDLPCLLDAEREYDRLRRANNLLEN
ncbi:MAG: ATP-binding protein [Acidobacteriota bacterium]